jgi:F-type H+-transporting ATPase subunit gamma
MANLKAIRRRIGSVQNTQKITRAMKMVAAAKLRRAQETVTSFRAYADLTQSILGEVSKNTQEKAHPLLEQRKENRSLILVISSDRGLCGPFNGNLLREVMRRMGESTISPELDLIGKKAKDYFSRRSATVRVYHKDVYENIGINTAKKLAAELSALYANGEVDRIDIAYNEFVSVMKQQPVVRPLLPIVLSEQESKTDTKNVKGEVPGAYLFEPSLELLLAALLPKYVEVQIYRALVESVAAEHASRMTAMEAATTAAGDMIDNLTLQYNRARQDAITKELMDIVGGAEALGD